LKILFLSPFALSAFPHRFPPSGRGLDHRTTWTELLVEYFSGNPEHEITLATVSPFIKYSCYFRENNVGYYYLKTVKRARRLLFFLPDIFRLRRIIKEIDPDLIHVHGAEDCYALATLYSSKPALVSIQAAFGEFARFYPWYSNVRLGPLLADFALKRTSFIHTNSPYIENYYKKVINKATLFRLDMPINKVFFEVENIPDEDVLTFVGSSLTLKGADTLIKIAGKLKNSFPRLIVNIIGYITPDLFAYLKKLALEHGVWENTRLIGALDTPAISKYLAKTKVFVVPTRCDIYGVSLAEALCAGVPVVSSNIMGVPYVVENEIDGFLLDPNDIKGFAEKINLLLSNNDLRRKMGQKGKEKAVKRWHPNIISKAYLETYKEILKD